MVDAGVQTERGSLCYSVDENEGGRNSGGATNEGNSGAGTGERSREEKARQ